MESDLGCTSRLSLIMWRWCYIMWRCCHRNHDNTITSVIAEKQTVINEVYVLVIFYWKIHKLHLFCWLNFSVIRKKCILIRLNPHATELIFLTPVPANKMELFHTEYIILCIMCLTYTRDLIRSQIVPGLPNCWHLLHWLFAFWGNFAWSYVTCYFF